MIRVFIPIYNEEKNIEKCIAGIAENLKRYKYVIYTVNDGSRDKSLVELKKAAKVYPLKIRSHSINRGVASAFKTGINFIAEDAKAGDVMVVMEGDSTSDPALLPSMIQKINQGADVVIASRYAEGGKYRRFPFKRLFFSRGANNLFKYIFPNEKVQDYTIFYRAYKWDIIQKAIDKFSDELITTKFFTANTELLVKLMSITEKFTEVPLVYDYGNKKGRSGLNIKRNLWQYIRLIVEYKLGI